MSVNVSLDASAVVRQLGNTAELDDTTRKYAHQRLAAYCEPYVPMETGTLAQSTVITEDYVEYIQPYAHYQYEGQIYGPNIPIRDQSGIVVGYFSPPGQPKQPTGRSLTYSKELHPMATDHWDQAAMAARRDDLLDDIANYIVKNGGN